ncbi:protein FAM98A-like [Chenopodium quinoa]|uniref:protein FAM98A-like n=1 Tax=Chenopodium quinoa TaxID=63459 RepID=UPI000B78D057|nr:protein FAM98A-like [Chenopodium quinoa]
MGALKHILRYLQGTLSYGLHLYKSSRDRLVSYTDADWGGCPDTRRSTSGYCVFLGDNLISWSSKRQPTLSKSSAEAEYRGVANVVYDSCWIRNLLLELFLPIRKATIVYCDNVSAIYLSDIFTKGLPRVLFDDFRANLSVWDTAQQVWDKIKNIFQDNKATRALYLESQFNDLHLSAFLDVSAYCKQLKSLKDQLANVDHPISERKLVLKLIGGLHSTDFDTVVAILAQTEPLPSFETARSKLLLEETRCNNEKPSQGSSFVAQQTNSTPIPNNTSQNRPPAPGGGGRGGGRGRGRGGKSGGGKNGGGRGRGRGNSQPSQQQQAPPSNNSGWAQQQQGPI